LVVIVLRLGHRYVRDDRVTTHLFLAARAFGADGVVYSGQRDPDVEESVRKVNVTWGGFFEPSHTPNWIKMVKDYKEKGWKVIHLTMYGQQLQTVADDIRSSTSDKLLVVGGSKVPREAYELADWNVAVTSQPHSEISALSVFLHELFKGEELRKAFSGGRLEIIPQPKGKKVNRKTYATDPGGPPSGK
jgi:tRNA (cytidine56-2'-O)-methyltransferase